MNFSYFDIHSHLHDTDFDADRDLLVAKMREEGIGTITVGTDKPMSERAIRCAENSDNVFASIGQHPVDKREEVFDMEWYAKKVEHPRVVAIGECGLDYYWPAKDGWKNGEAEEKNRQQELFRSHIELAAHSGKPLMIHGRPSGKTQDAYNDILAILKQSPPVRGDVHFFAGDISIARAFLDLGFSLSFTGVITFTHDYDEVIRYIPLENIMAETDAPYVTPVPYRGKRNIPSYVSHITKRFAEIHGLELTHIQNILEQNRIRVFPLTENNS